MTTTAAADVRCDATTSVLPAPIIDHEVKTQPAIGVDSLANQPPDSEQEWRDHYGC